MLEEILGSDEVHFQPPRNVRMEYPAIVYNVDDLDTKFADNHPYAQKVGYALTVIHRDPDNQVWREVGRLRYCSFDRFDVVDNLNHYYFTLYF